MSSEIGYGAAAIKSGETRYHQAIANLVKEAAQRKPAESTQAADHAPAKSASEHVGRNVDVKA